jgi:hypothetical protein
MARRVDRGRDVLVVGTKALQVSLLDGNVIERSKLSADSERLVKVGDQGALNGPLNMTPQGRLSASTCAQSGSSSRHCVPIGLTYHRQLAQLRRCIDYYLT